MKRASKAPASRYCHFCNKPVLTARESLFMNVDGEKRLFHQELCYGYWQQVVAARAREEAREEARKARKALKKERADQISNLRSQQQAVDQFEQRKFRTREPQLSEVSLRDLLIEVANRIAARLDGIEQSGLRLQTLVDQLLRGGRA